MNVFFKQLILVNEDDLSDLHQVGKEKQDLKGNDLYTPQDVLLLVQKIRIYSYSSKKISKLLKRLLVIIECLFLENRKYFCTQNICSKMWNFNLNFSAKSLL